MSIKNTMHSNGKKLQINAPIIREYNDILEGRTRRFSDGTWQAFDAKENAKLVLRYLFEEKLNMSFDELKKLNSYHFKTKWKLNGLFKYVYNGSFQDAIVEIYEPWINSWDFSRATRYLNNNENLENWLIDFAEEYLHFDTKQELIEFFSTPNLRKNHGKIFNYFDGSPYKVYKYFFPKGEVKPYEFKMGYNNIWGNKVLVNDYLTQILKSEEIKSKEAFVDFLQSKSFRTNMKGLLNHFGSSPWNVYQYLKEENLINFDLSVFDLNVLPNGYYKSEENQVAALKWLIEKLKINSKEEFIKKMSTKTLDAYIRGLGVYLSDNETLYSFIENHNIIPWNIKPWEYRYRPSTLWENEDVRLEAITWFFENYLGLNKNEVNVNSFKVKDIWDARLKELYQPYFSQVYSNPKEMWVNTYKNKFSEDIEV